MVLEGGCSIPPAGGFSVICHSSQAGPVPSLWSSKESVKVLCLVQPSCHRGGAAGPQGGQHLSRVTLCVAESESGPGVLSPGRVSVHGPTLLVTSAAAASSRLGFCPVHPRPAQTCPIPLRRALTAAESVSSSARWGRGARDPWSIPPPSSRGPWICQSWRLRRGDGAGSLPSVHLLHPLCLFLLGLDLVMSQLQHFRNVQALFTPLLDRIC